ncbi:hypothetical protein F8M41_014745 [Gigaspora margarita]|uniref:Uncharacterized protein n=1 Tax=Gigaspora margarita TaxID=4874 RepID=A0A8H4ARH7_GIGMA|nr:hypothetical protein F8M41_014745 [Gigaspora margarita]
MSFNVDYENIAVKELALNSAVKEVGLNSAEHDKTPDVYTKDDNFSETSTESDEISDNNNNVFEDYLAPILKNHKNPIIYLTTIDLHRYYYG